MSKIKSFFGHAIRISIFAFFAAQNINLYFRIKALQMEAKQLTNKEQILISENKKITHHIYLMKNNDIDLIETKSMWSLGYSPINSKILLH